MAWINSDDYYQPQTFYKVANLLENTSKPLWLAGASYCFEDGKQGSIRLPGKIDLEQICTYRINWFCQQSIFWTRKMWEKTDALDENLHLAMDYDLWLRMWTVQKPITTNDVLAFYRYHINAKCGVYWPDSPREMNRILKKFIKTELIPNVGTKYSRQDIKIAQKESKILSYSTLSSRVRGLLSRIRTGSSPFLPSKSKKADNVA